MAEEYGHIKKALAGIQKSKQFADSMELSHSEFMAQALRKHITTDDGMGLDYSLLDTEEKNKAVRETLKDLYRSRAKKLLASGLKEDDPFFKERQALAFTAVAGVAEEQLDSIFRNYGSRLTHQLYSTQFAPQLTKQMRNSMKGVYTSHLENEDIGDIVKHTGADKILQPKDIGQMSLEKAIDLLEEFATKNEVTKDFLAQNQYILPRKLKKPEEKKKSA